MLIPIEIVLKGRDFAVTESLTVPHGEPSTWDDFAVRDVLIEILRAIDRAQNPSAPADRVVALRGFSWIVEPLGEEVVLAIEIPMGAAVAGPFNIPQKTLETMIARVLQIEKQLFSSTTVH